MNIKSILSSTLAACLVWLNGPGAAFAELSRPISRPAARPLAAPAAPVGNRLIPADKPLSAAPLGSLAPLEAAAAVTLRADIAAAPLLPAPLIAAPAVGLLSAPNAAAAGPAEAKPSAARDLRSLAGLPAADLSQGLRQVIDGARRHADTLTSAPLLPEVMGRAAQSQPEQPQPNPESVGEPLPILPISAVRLKEPMDRAYWIWRAILGFVFRLAYPLRVHGLDNLPKEGGALLLPNHVSYVDVFLLSLAAGRPIRFLMYERYYRNRWIHWFVKQFKPIPIIKEREWLEDQLLDAVKGLRVRRQRRPGFEQVRKSLLRVAPSRDEWKAGIFTALESAFKEASRDPQDQLLAQAYARVRWHVENDEGRKAVMRSLDQAHDAIENGDFVSIFPEGTLTPTGTLSEFQKGFLHISEGLKEPVIPVFVDGLWGSILSRKPYKSLWKYLKGMPRKTSIRFGKPLGQVERQTAYDAISLLGADAMTERIRRLKKPLARAFVHSAKRFWGRFSMADSTGKSLTFGKALVASLLLGGALRPQLQAQRNVGVLLPPAVGGALANTALGVLGKVSMNLNYSASPEALNSSLEQAGIQKILTSRKFMEALERRTQGQPFYWKEHADRLIYLEDLAPKIPKWKSLLYYVMLYFMPASFIEDFFLQDAAMSLDDTAAIIFTSGSSGLPKGVELSHLNIQANVEMVSDVYPMDKGEVVLGILPFFHVFGFTITLWLPLLVGVGTAYHNHPRDVEGIDALAREKKPTILFSTPSFLRDYIKGVSQEAFSKLWLIITGAEALSPETADDFEAKFDPEKKRDAKPKQGYGTTELSPVAILTPPNVDGAVNNVPGSVGKPLPGQAVRIVDPATFEPVPWGTPGMLLIYGPNVMKGYLGQPDKTAAVMKDGWYVTGDIAVMDERGYVSIVGRLSRFSKIMGEMVSHVEAETRLNKAASVPDGTFVVAAVPDADRGERLMIFYTDFTGDLESLVARAKEQGMPGFWKVEKGSFHKVKEIPMLGSGKLDLAALKKLAESLAPKK